MRAIIVVAGNLSFVSPGMLCSRIDIRGEVANPSTRIATSVFDLRTSTVQRARKLRPLDLRIENLQVSKCVRLETD
jgi:hypothetical protein